MDTGRTWGQKACTLVAYSLKSSAAVAPMESPRNMTFSYSRVTSSSLLLSEQLLSYDG